MNCLTTARLEIIKNKLLITDDSNTQECVHFQQKHTKKATQRKYSQTNNSNSAQQKIGKKRIWKNKGNIATKTCMKNRYCATVTRFRHNK